MIISSPQEFFLNSFRKPTRHSYKNATKRTVELGIMSNVLNKPFQRLHVINCLHGNGYNNDIYVQYHDFELS